MNKIVLVRVMNYFLSQMKEKVDYISKRILNSKLTYNIQRHYIQRPTDLIFWLTESKKSLASMLVVIGFNHTFSLICLLVISV